MINLICIILSGIFVVTAYQATARPAYKIFSDTANLVSVTESDSTRNTLSVGLLAGNNSYFFGRSTDIPYPYLAANISYKLKSGFWAGTTLYHIKGIQNYIDETNLSAGWDFNLTGRLDGSLSYTRYIYGSDNPLLQSVASNLAMGYLGYDWSFVYSSLTASYLFGEFNDVFLGLNNSRYFGKKNIFGSNDYLGIEPTLNLLAGTQFFTETYTTKIETPNNGNKWNGNNGKGNGNNGNNGNGNENNGNGNWNSGNNGNTSTTTTINTIVESKFTLLNYGFTLPLIYGFGNNSFELSWRLLVPTNVPAEFSKKPRSFFTFSYYHSFNL